MASSNNNQNRSEFIYYFYYVYNASDALFIQHKQKHCITFNIKKNITIKADMYYVTFNL